MRVAVNKVPAYTNNFDLVGALKTQQLRGVSFDPAVRDDVDEYLGVNANVNDPTEQAREEKRLAAMGLAPQRAAAHDLKAVFKAMPFFDGLCRDDDGMRMLTSIV